MEYFIAFEYEKAFVSVYETLAKPFMDFVTIKDVTRFKMLVV